MSTYSFLNINCAMVGPGIVTNLGAGAQVAEEGITLEPTEDKNVMTIGADGQGQQTLIASDAHTLTVRLLKTSPLNSALMIAYNLQSASSALWGTNTITVTDSARNDLHVCQKVAFKKKPTIAYNKAGDMLEWTFDCQSVTSVLGAG